MSDLKPDAEGHWPPPFEFNGKPCLLVRTPDGEIRAFNAICTHVGCTVECRPAEGDIFCNCHNGVYNLNGQNISGPPPRPLQEYKVTTQTGTGGDHCLPKHMRTRRRASGRTAATGFVSRRFEAAKAYCIERLGLEEIQALAAHKQVPIHRTSIFYFLGGMALFLFVIQVITGILLSLYYKASPDQAFESVRAIMTEIDYGWLIRSIHSWSANLLVGVLLLHVLTTFIMRAYRRPREATWVTGLLLLGIFFAFGFSGYLLSVEPVGVLRDRVGTQIMGAVPVIGKEMLLVARSGENVTGDTLARFYSLHVVILPLVTLGILGVHLYLVQKHGMSVPENAARRWAAQRPCPRCPSCRISFYGTWSAGISLWDCWRPWRRCFPGNLARRQIHSVRLPQGIKPEWYFLFMFETLKQCPVTFSGSRAKWWECSFSASRD